MDVLIDNYMEGRRARRILDQLRGVSDRIAANGRNKDNHKDVIRNLRGILLDRRHRSMKITEQPDTRNTKSKHVHTVTDKLGDMKRTIGDNFHKALKEELENVYLFVRACVE